jgi:hypothetical protein
MIRKGLSFLVRFWWVLAQAHELFEDAARGDYRL